MVLDRVFTKEEINDIMYNGEVRDGEDNLLFEGVKEKIKSFDREKNSTSIEYVIKECSTGKYYMANLCQSSWYLQDEYNCKEIWQEVKRKKVVKYKYELV